MVPARDYPEPTIVGCRFVYEVQPVMPVLLLQWDTVDVMVHCSWRLPGGIRWTGAWPGRFGVVIRRLGYDSYQVRLLWDELYWMWSGLPATEIRRSGIAHVLWALGTDVEGLLAQPVRSETRPEIHVETGPFRRRAA
ncbi:MAG TPA: hypothetical protein PKD86_15845 [Gemmatales bacterium]|nr:hypothetical protein [Gemmatales bacterium]HMP60817.1 hypothetical protein [Gemmatales bacterium]